MRHNGQKKNQCPSRKSGMCLALFSGIVERLKSKRMKAGTVFTGSFVKDRVLHSGQQGRSMIEVLGVLAIMGVLSLVGLWGYRAALDRIMANEIVHGVSLRAVVIGQQRVLDHELDLSEFHPNTEEDLIYDRFPVAAFNDYPNDGVSEYGRNVIENSALKGLENIQAIEVSEIPSSVCHLLRKTTFVDPTYTAINGTYTVGTMVRRRSMWIVCRTRGQ